MKMKTKENEQCNAVLKNLRKTAEIRGRVKSNGHETVEEVTECQG